MPGIISILRIPLTLLAIIMPGYSLSLALFAERLSIDSLERFAIALTTGVAITSLEGFIILKLNILLNPLHLMIFSLSVSTILAAIGLLRMRRRSPAVPRPSALLWFRRTNKLLWALLLVVLALSVVGASLVVPSRQPDLTEFYISPDWFENTGRKYINMEIGGVPLNVPIEINNLGLQAADYRIVAFFDEVQVWHRGDIHLNGNAHYTNIIPILPYQLTVPHVLRIELYKDDQTTSTATLTLAIG